MAKEPRIDEKITQDVKEYVRMRIDALKLGAIEDLSGLLGGAIALIIMLLLCMLALMLFTVAAVYGLSLLVESMLCSALIMGSIYILLGVIVFYKRAFFISMMVGMFSRMFFKRRREEGEDED